MARQSTRAGGCFLTLFIAGGFLLGVAMQDPMKGVLLGTAAGAVVAMLLWLLDRRREG